MAASEGRNREGGRMSDFQMFLATFGGSLACVSLTAALVECYHRSIRYRMAQRLRSLKGHPR